eukprot:TRINITY_DN138636_c0_g1_i1.p1 TRINITY_DN138636_c0_g1~~TRINITY_DN138636_c0_g1_i1.p1  ORF type:complete len:297 (-),score=20.81 TRINITY_DN138636_c0_g1_i1:208-1098(-)
MKKFEEIAGLGFAKATLKETVVNKLGKLGGSQKPTDNTVLLYGVTFKQRKYDLQPGGTGKTSLVLACAAASKAALLYVNCTVIPAKEGTKDYFKTVIEKAKGVSPAIIFIDDIDWLCRPEASSPVKELRGSFIEDTKELANLSSVSLIGATSEPWFINPEVYQVFTKKVFIPLPNQAERAELFKAQLNPRGPDITEADITEFAKRTDGLTGQRVSILIKDALFEPLRKCKDATKFRVLEDGSLEPTREDDPSGLKCTIEELKNPDKLKVPYVTKVPKLYTKNIGRRIQSVGRSKEC